jgi:hypothetical protein
MLSGWGSTSGSRMLVICAATPRKEAIVSGVQALQLSPHTVGDGGDESRKHKGVAEHSERVKE